MLIGDHLGQHLREGQVRLAQVIRGVERGNGGEVLVCTELVGQVVDGHRAWSLQPVSDLMPQVRLHTVRGASSAVLLAPSSPRAQQTSGACTLDAQ